MPLLNHKGQGDIMAKKTPMGFIKPKFRETVDVTAHNIDNMERLISETKEQIKEGGADIKLATAEQIRELFNK